MKAQEFRRHLVAFQGYNRSRDLSPRTIQTYNDGLQRFLQWFLDLHGGKAEITSRRIREFAAHRLAWAIYSRKGGEKWL